MREDGGRQTLNVLFILADQHNASFTGCYGGITRTPNLDELALEGTVFERAYTPSPMCAPARACLFSGRYVMRIAVGIIAFPTTGMRFPGGAIISGKRGYIWRPSEDSTLRLGQIAA